MTTPKDWVPGERITAVRLNELRAAALSPRREVSLGNGSSLVNEALANQSSNMQRPEIRIAIATEDFALQTAATDLIVAAIDDVPSAKCRMMRLNRATGVHETETGTLPFRAYDVIAGLMEATYKVKSEVFYVAFNQDTKRWEVLSSFGGMRRIRFTIVEVNCVDYDNDELNVRVRWTHYTGGCGGPPDVDYEGYITVYDTCILSYFTVEDLIDKRGSATHWYSRAEYSSVCEGRWLIDDLCGSPEC